MKITSHKRYLEENSIFQHVHMLVCSDTLTYAYMYLCLSVQTLLVADFTMPLWSVEEWRARIGSCWCALGRPFNTRFTRNRGKSRRVLTLHQLLTMVIMLMLLIVANLILHSVDHGTYSSEL